MASTDELRRLLGATSLPGSLIEEFVAGTNALWLATERADVVAGEVVLCHPPLEPAEVRAVVKPTELADRWHITVLTADRPGLLAATAAVLASAGLSVRTAAVTVLPTSRLALQRVTVEADPDTPDAAWDDLGGRLRHGLGAGEEVRVRWTPSEPVTVTCHPQGSGRVLVQVAAPDTTGLLWAVARAISDGGANIEAARLATEDGLASDVFVVDGDVDSVRLARALGAGDVVVEQSSLGRVLTAPFAAGVIGLRRGADLIGRLGGGPDRPR